MVAPQWVRCIYWSTAKNSGYVTDIIKKDLPFIVKISTSSPELLFRERKIKRQGLLWSHKRNPGNEVVIF